MKKSKWNDFRQTFFLIGLVIALTLCNLAFTYTSYDRPVYKVNIPPEPESTIIILQTVWEKSKPKLPKPLRPKPATPKEIAELILVDEQLPEDHIEDVPDIIDTVQAPSIGRQEEVAPIAEPVVEKDREPFIMAERMPCFEGCEDFDSEDERRNCTSEKLLRFIYKNVKYPATARKLGIQGTVVARFVISKTGQIEDIKILRSAGGGMDEESIRVIKLFPQWTPGKQNGRPVKVLYTFPFRYHLQG